MDLEETKVINGCIRECNAHIRETVRVAKPTDRLAHMRLTAGLIDHMATQLYDTGRPPTELLTVLMVNYIHLLQQCASAEQLVDGMVAGALDTLTPEGPVQ